MKVFKQVVLNGSKLMEIPFKREFELQGYLIAHPELLSLKENDEGFEVAGLIGVERKLKNGRVDMVVQYASGKIAIVELKKGELRECDYNQLSRYLERIDELKQWKVFDEYRKINEGAEVVVEKGNVFGLLVGTSVSRELSKKKKSKHVINVMAVKRYKSNDNEFLITDTILNFSQKDYAKFLVEGRGPFSKGRTVLEVVKKYVKDHKDVEYNSLVEEVFPSSLRGTRSRWGCVNIENDARDLYARTNSKRHFLNDEDIITLKNGTRIAVSREWNAKNIKTFIGKAKELRIRVEEVKGGQS